MIPLDALTTFAIASFLLALAPGPDNIFVVTQSALSGARAGVIVVLGLCTGVIFHSAAVALGIAAIVKASALAFTTLKLAGAAYLLYLAYQAFNAPPQSAANKATPLSAMALYRRGVIMNITNPKVAIFFLAFFPQFTNPANGSIILQVAILGAIFAGAAFITFSCMAMAAGQLSQWLLKSQKAQRWINRMAGLVFIGLAANIALSER